MVASGPSARAARSRSASSVTWTSTTSRPSCALSSLLVPDATSLPWSMIAMMCGEPVGLVEVLGGEQHVGASGREVFDRDPQLVAAAGVETGGGLVEQQQARRTHEAGAEVETPLHAARIGAHQPVAVVGEAHLVEDGVGGDAWPRRGRDRRGGRSSGGSRGRSSPLRRPRTGPARPIVRRTCFGSLATSMPGHPQRARGGAGERGDRADQRGLARTVRAEDGEHLARWGRRGRGRRARATSP